jgi:hypothetical protein
VHMRTCSWSAWAILHDHMPSGDSLALYLARSGQSWPLALGMKEPAYSSLLLPATVPSILSHQAMQVSSCMHPTISQATCMQAHRRCRP